MAFNTGYYRFPTINNNKIIFVCEDDLWAVKLDSENHPVNSAYRLSANPGVPTRPAVSPDGESIAFISRDEGQSEVYVMPVNGGQAQRLTYLGATTFVLGWHPHKKDTILFASDASQAFMGQYNIYEIFSKGGVPIKYPFGPALFITFNPAAGKNSKNPVNVILRNGGGRGMGDPSMWKRYKGGKTGTLWIDNKGDGKYKQLIDLNGDIASPMWIGKRIYFLADHEGYANIYSCTPTGKDLKRHTDHEDFYVRFPQSDGKHIVYACGAKIYILDTHTDKYKLLDIETPSTRPQRNRKYADASQYLETYDLHPNGHSLCVTTRGKPFTFAHWEEAVTQRGVPDGRVRYRYVQWLPNGEDTIGLSDETGDNEELIILKNDGSIKNIPLKLDIGRASYMKISQVKSYTVALANHKQELIIIDPAKKQAKVVATSKYDRISNLDWSPDGRWLAYTYPTSVENTELRIYDTKTGKSHKVTTGDFRDNQCAFDPEGNYLYFLSYCEFDPVYDNLIFDLGFPQGMRLLAIPLTKDLPSPFIPTPKAPGSHTGKNNDKNSNNKNTKDKSNTPTPVKIDFTGIEKRIVACPITEGNYGQVYAIEGKILFSSFPIEGALSNNNFGLGTPAAKGTLDVYDLDEQKRETLITGISNFKISNDGKVLAYRAGNKLRVIKAGDKPNDKNTDNTYNRKSGWIDLARIRLSISPPAEWTQMFTEAWRLQRDHYWVPDMSGTNWKKVYRTYKPLIDKVASRSEFSDLLWELQGELGTSHAYEFGGDYNTVPMYQQGFLGADLAFDKKAKNWKIIRLPQGDSWKHNAASPLAAPGVNLKVNDRILAIGNTKVDNKQIHPNKYLVNLAGQYVNIKIADTSGKNKRTVTVRTLGNETGLRYRDWVENNRNTVHKATGGQVGYVHIPDMGANGYAEFHRYYLAELSCTSLIVDVRFNRGGHVSQLILEKLLRNRVGYDLKRWGVPFAYPEHSVKGPIVALTNANSGSDGDIFSHCFKLYNLGPLIGKRTWGGVIGINPRHTLVDGTITTQPEFSFWFKDVAFGVENYGTDPDIDIDILPQDHAAGKDPQLTCAIKEVTKLLQNNPPIEPDINTRPSLKLKRLPKYRIK